MEHKQFLLSKIATATFAVGVLLFLLGGALALRGDSAAFEMSIAGQELKSSSIGLAIVFLGSILIIANVRRILASFEKADTNTAGSAEILTQRQSSQDTNASAANSTLSPNISKEPQRGLRSAPAPTLKPVRRINTLMSTDHSLIEEVVYKDRRCVLKRTKKSLVHFNSLRRLVGAELTGWSRQMPARIATPLEVWEEGDEVFEISEYYEGILLSELLLSNKHSLKGEALGLIYTNLLRALGEMHSLGILHRDITPYNLLLTREGEIILLDLSFCCAEDEKQQIPVENSAFSPPEQRTGKACYQSDYYSLGATIYFLANREPPRWHNQDSYVLGLEKIDLGDMWSREASSKGFINVVEWLLQEDPVLRPRFYMEAHLTPQSRSIYRCLIGVLDAGDLGVLLLYEQSTAFVKREEAYLILREVGKEFFESRVPQAEIEIFLNGGNPWRYPP